jgi:hypothetical protein
MMCKFQKIRDSGEVCFLSLEALVLYEQVVFCFASVVESGTHESAKFWVT